MTRYTIVWHGERDATWPPLADGRAVHTLHNVWRHMVQTIALEYPGLSPLDAERLRVSEVAWWYDGLRPRLVAQTKPVKRRSK